MKTIDVLHLYVLLCDRNIDVASVTAVDEASLRVEWADFERALGETLPAFGNKDGDEIASHFRNGVCNYGPTFDELWGTLQRLLNQTRLSTRTPLMSVLLEGQVLCAAVESFPLILCIVNIIHSHHPTPPIATHFSLHAKYCKYCH